MNQQSPYQLLGDDKIRELASAFYDAMDELTEAEDIRRMHSDNLDEIKEKLYEYLCGWMGGPPKYMEKYGTICLTDPHKPYAIGAEHRDQWLLCMDRALEKIGAPEQVKTMLKDPMYDLADFIRNT
ncbi:group II truncated hemoglobin [Pseudomaricurvus alkylphenolicus]|jgi:hemoglobin|uniref:group II truncated hemoglobin n=1 Tax=Pseudomaricurvus alkylphenolicus TaxID=1306991 RepID=UPI00141F3B56|nr:group II truncated hemoglobin [Pseudomaricurvus alkylphenolicus]NIB39066.1 group II truncated hemoglobin [Pseudomaricurvus alkylphenolicus]